MLTRGNDTASQCLTTTDIISDFDSYCDCRVFSKCTSLIFTSAESFPVPWTTFVQKAGWGLTALSEIIRLQLNWRKLNWLFLCFTDSCDTQSTVFTHVSFTELHVLRQFITWRYHLTFDTFHAEADRLNSHRLLHALQQCTQNARIHILLFWGIRYELSSEWFMGDRFSETQRHSTFASATFTVPTCLSHHSSPSS